MDDQRGIVLKAPTHCRHCGSDLQTGWAAYWAAAWNGDESADGVICVVCFTEHLAHQAEHQRKQHPQRTVLPPQTRADALRRAGLSERKLARWTKERTKQH